MADAPPPGPPPPKVPEGWKAVWNTQYNEWFFVNKYTKVSQWDKPTEAAVDPNAHGENAPAGPPPAYLPSSTSNTAADEKHNPNNPYNSSGNRSSQDVDADAKYAAKLQAEENARAASARPTSSNGGTTRGAADSYYQGSSGGQQNYHSGPTSPQNYSGQTQQQQQQPQQEGKRGFLGKLLGKSSHPPQQQGYSQGYGRAGGYPPQQYPPQGQYYGQGYPPQQGYGGGGYYGGGPPPVQYVQQQPQKSGGIGAGGALLGAGAGLVGGALLMDAFEDHEQFEQQQAYDAGENQGYDQGYDQGFDAGNDDMGGGDF